MRLCERLGDQKCVFEWGKLSKKPGKMMEGGTVFWVGEKNGKPAKLGVWAKKMEGGVSKKKQTAVLLMVAAKESMGFGSQNEWLFGGGAVSAVGWRATTERGKRKKTTIFG